MDKAYRMLSAALTPLLPLWLGWRALRGKEEWARLKERRGAAAGARPGGGTLLWLHAASVGEANSVLRLIGKIRARHSHVSILMTTGTVTSARLMQARLPEGAIHQYAPLDAPRYVKRFLRRWQPDIGLFVESEFWPNLIEAADKAQCFLGLVNGRMSERSFAFWQTHPDMIRRMLRRFDCVFAQSEDDAGRMRLLGAPNVICEGNLKYDAALLPCDEAELVRLQGEIGPRPVWLAASTHDGEEALIAKAHHLLAATRPDLLTLIVPRHPGRGGKIAAGLGAPAARRARRDKIASRTAFYVADTLGELGLFYRLSGIVFMGGSFVRHGGHNPLEPARLACAVLAGPHVRNFSDIYRAMEQEGACLTVDSPAALAAQVDRLLNQPATKSAMQEKARQWVESQGGASDRLLEWIGPLLAPVKKRARP